MRNSDILRRVLALVATAVAATGFLVAPGAHPAQAAQAAPPARTVWVDAYVNKAWPVSKAVAFVDKYTGSTMRLGKCRTGAQCITIRESYGVSSKYAAVTNPGYPKSSVTLNPSRRTVSSTQRYHILVHELAHANGVYAHAASCKSVMYYNVHCSSGALSKLAFTAAEIRTLKIH